MVKKTVADYHMVTTGDRVLIGVSGGPDSMVLLHLFHHLAPEWRIEIGIAHLNHRLRKDAADADAALVWQTAAEMQHPCHMVSADVRKVQRKRRLSPEDAARRVRYAFFNKIMKQEGYNRLALGHHLDDNAEQVLLAFLRGSGSRGLSGIAPVRQSIIRPLIHIRKNAIEHYARAHGIVYRLDASNTDLCYARNQVRHQLLPFLSDTYTPRVHRHLARLADIMRSEEAWLSELTEQHYTTLVTARKPGMIFLCANTLARSPLGLARRLVRRAIEDCHGDLRRITFDHITAILGLLTQHGDNGQLHLPSGIRVRRNGNQLILWQGPSHRHVSPPQDIPAPQAVLIPLPFPDVIESAIMGIGLRLSLCDPENLPNWQVVSSAQAFVDLEKIQWPLVLRFPRPGDRFTPLGVSGSQKIKKFFIDHHVPPAMRRRLPILTDQTRILWLIGKRMDDFFRVTEKTNHVLKIDYFLLDT